jgi:hypothetical protein
MPRHRRRRNTHRLQHLDPPQHACEVAEAVAKAWRQAYVSSQLEVPLGVVAGLSLLAVDDPDGPDLADQILELSPTALRDYLRDLWLVFCASRPELAPRSQPLWAWLDDPADHTLNGAKAVATAALRTGLLQLTGITIRRHEVDLLGLLLQDMRGRGDRRTRGQFYTPGGVSLLAARVLGPPRPDEDVLEPCAGTGSMVRAAAEAMRENGDDPARVTWVLNDIDHLAVACLAVNTHLWGLGRQVLPCAGDALDPRDDWIGRAQNERLAAFTRWRLCVAIARTVIALRQLGASPPRA